MSKQKILKEAQQIASQFSFWMVSGNIDHIFGYVYEYQDKKYGLEIKFPPNFPQDPPKVEFHDEVKELLGNVNLSTLRNWTPQSAAIDIVKELAHKIKQALGISSETYQSIISTENQDLAESGSETQKPQPQKTQESSQQSQDLSDQQYITPDLNAYPPDFNTSTSNGSDVSSQTFSEEDVFIDDSAQSNEPNIPKESNQSNEFDKSKTVEMPNPHQTHDFVSGDDLFADTETKNLNVTTELSLIRQEYAFDEIGTKPGQIQVYLTITLTKTFLIKLNLSNYPEKPIITVPSEVRKIIGDPYQSLTSLKNWNQKNPPHVVETLRELEKKLFSIKDIEKELQKIKREYQFQQLPGKPTKLRIHILTYGFQEYLMDIDLDPYPDPPKIELSTNLKQLVDTPIKQLNSVENWTEGESEVVEIIREISWLVDKNSRINFELELLREDYKNIQYDSETETLKIQMEGKMKTEDLQFQFEIKLPRAYPMEIPEIRILNKFDLESHEKAKQDLEASFKDFFDEWTPYSYLVDLFHLISKKIFEVSAVSCVICHQLDCPTCSLKISGTDEKTCFVECPYCDRAYHEHCWNQTLKSFGKCGFCLKTPPPSMRP